jgi:hypothetical protein
VTGAVAVRLGAVGRKRSGEQYSHIILGNLRIAPDWKQPGRPCLCHQKPFEGVAMMVGEVFGCSAPSVDRVAPRHWLALKIN